MRPQSSMGFGETLSQAQECGQSYVLFFYWRQGTQRNDIGASTYCKISRKARIRSRFRSLNAHDEQKRLKLTWIGHFSKIQELHCGACSQWRSACKRGSTSVRSRSWSLRGSASTRRSACCSFAWKTLRRSRIFLRVGQQSKNLCWPKQGKAIFCKTDHVVPLVVPGLSTQFCRQFVVNIDIAGFVFNKSSPRAKWRTSCRKLVRITLKDPQPKKKMAIEIRTTVCEIFLNGWRSSQIIWRTLKCMHPHTFLRTQIRHVPRKWYQNKGTTVFTLNSQKTEIAKCAGESKWQGLLAEDALAKLYLEQKSLVTW